MSLVLNVDPDCYASSAADASQFATDLRHALDTFTGSMSRTDGMAGSDDAGVKVADAYDHSAASFVTGMGRLVDTIEYFALGLSVCGRNHAIAEHAACGLAGEPAGYELRPQVVAHRPAPLPTASGGSNADLPDGFEFVVDMIGAAWPNGDPSKLRNAATAWTTLADDLARLCTRTYSLTDALTGSRSPELGLIENRLTSIREALMNAPMLAREHTEELTTLADHIDEVRADTTHELNLLLAELVVILGASAVTSFFTFGAAGVVGGGAAAIRVGTSVTRIFYFISTLTTRAGMIAGRLSTTITGALRMDAALAGLTTRVVTATAQVSVFGIGGAATSAAATAIVDGKDGDYERALINGFLGGAAGGALGMGAIHAFQGIAARATARTPKLATNPETARLVADPTAPYGRNAWGIPHTHAGWEHKYRPHGKLNYPPNGGAVPGTEVTFTSMEDYITQYGSGLDRIGSPYGEYMAVMPRGRPVSFEARALPIDSLEKSYFTYTAVGKLPSDWKITVSEVAPWFGQPGGSTQVLIKDSQGITQTIRQLEKKGILR